MAEKADANFKQLVRLLYKYIRATHHTSNLYDEDGNPGLYRLKSTARWLETLIHPATPTPQTDLLLYGNARNWLHVSLDILK